MPFQTNRLQRIYQQLTDEVAEVRRRAVSLQDQAAVGSVQSTQILDWFTSLASSKEAIASLASTPGLANYAKNESNDSGYDIAVSFNAMTAAIDACLAWVTTNYPKDVNGYIQSHTFSGTSIVARNFTTLQTTPLRTVLGVLISTISS